MGARRALALAVLLALGLAPACATRRGVVSPELVRVAESGDALALSDALESLVANGRDTAADREYAYGSVRAAEQDAAGYAFARATVTGRLIQSRGLLGASLVRDVERWALRSRALDPGFRDGAATRLLGTLYVLAPASLLEHGDSERGLELLEGLALDHPEGVENHLRLAEAYIGLHDPGPAGPHLCVALARRTQLRSDEQKLLDALLAEAGTPDCTTRN